MLFRSQTHSFSFSHSLSHALFLALSLTLSLSLTHTHTHKERFHSDHQQSDLISLLASRCAEPLRAPPTAINTHAHCTHTVHTLQTQPITTSHAFHSQTVTSRRNHSQRQLPIASIRSIGSPTYRTCTATLPYTLAVFPLAKLASRDERGLLKC